MASKSHVVSGTDLVEVVNASPPFVTMYVNIEETTAAVEQALASIEVDEAVRTRMVEAFDTFAMAATDDIAACCLVAAPSSLWSFGLSDPVRRTVARVGGHPSLGSLVEATSLMPPHAVVTVEDGVYGLTCFGSAQVRPEEFASADAFESVAAVREALSFVNADKIMVAGVEVEASALVDDLSASFPLARVELLDAALASEAAMADEVVRSAAALASERISHELAMFRAARAAGSVVEGPSVAQALDDGGLDLVLVHDDPDDDRRRHGERLVDVVVARAIAEQVRIVMIPDVSEENGPAAGLGGVRAGTASLPAEMADLVATGPATVAASPDQAGSGRSPSRSGLAVSEREPSRDGDRAIA